jgi:Predicted P-loop ATPase fused to an acetyltransferase
VVIRKIEANKKLYIKLLLLADEQENMIDRYLERGTMYALADNEAIAVCVVTDEGSGVLEIKNIAVDPKRQKQGFGSTLIDFIIKEYKNDYHILQVGTGESPEIINFYEKCGFRQSHRVKNFFIDHYDHPMYEDGVQLVDMIYLQIIF